MLSFDTSEISEGIFSQIISNAQCICCYMLLDFRLNLFNHANQVESL